MPRKQAKWVKAALLTLLATACSAAGGDPMPPTATMADATPTPTSAPTVAVETPELNGTRWLLTSLHGADIDDQLTIELSFTFRQAGGYIGCGSYGGAYVSGNDGSFAMPEVFSNSELCDVPGDLASFAETYYGALESANIYRVIDDVLELQVADDVTTLVFAPDTRDALDGTSWGAAPAGDRPVIDNTRMTAKFSDSRSPAWPAATTTAVLIRLGTMVHSRLVS